MDEILTRWASDLTKYTKDFRTHAETVSKWDQILVSNLQETAKIYIKTVTSEKQMQSVEMALSAVEKQQDELEGWLTRYERDVDEMMTKNSVGQGEMGGPDQERERTYKLAERLGERLDDMGKDLVGMIEEVNSVTAGISRSGGRDEPVCFLYFAFEYVGVVLTLFETDYADRQDSQFTSHAAARDRPGDGGATGQSRVGTKGGESDGLFEWYR
jgi:nuclear pore complex protein Nup62